MNLWKGRVLAGLAATLFMFTSNKSSAAKFPVKALISLQSKNSFFSPNLLNVFTRM